MRVYHFRILYQHFAQVFVVRLWTGLALLHFYDVALYVHYICGTTPIIFHFSKYGPEKTLKLPAYVLVTVGGHERAIVKSVDRTYAVILPSETRVPSGL